MDNHKIIKVLTECFENCVEHRYTPTNNMDYDEILAVYEFLYNLTKENKDKYVLVQWPETQELMMHERFNECLLIQDIDGHDEVGSSSYMCPEDLYEEIFNNLKE